MSTLTVAAWPISGPLPRAPRHSLLSMAQDIADPQAFRGVAMIPYPPGVPKSIEQCADGSLAVKDDPDDLTLPDAFQAFMGYLGEICTARSIGEEYAEWQQRANDAFLARRSWLLERQLMNGTYATMPYMGNAHAQVVSGALPTRAAVAQLEALGAQTGQEYWLHVPPEVAAHGGYNVFQEDRGGILRTASGAPVVVGHGYSQDDNGNPDEHGAPPDGESAAGDRKSWIYVTGPVMAHTGATVFLNPETMSDARDWAQNTVIYRAEQEMVVGWDGQLQGAVLADWSGS